MSLPNFQYLLPSTDDELKSMLAEHGEKAKILSGGTDLLIRMKERLDQPDCVIDISALKTLKRIEYEEGKGLTIGAATNIRELEFSKIIGKKYHALSKAAEAIGSPQVREMGTVGGNICNASPAADTPPALIAFGASVNLISSRGQREMLLEDFILGNRVTAIEEDEFLEQIRLEEPWLNSGSSYLYMGLRGAMEIDMVSVAVNLALDAANDKVSHVRIVMGAVAPTPLRARGAEKILLGRIPEENVLREAAEACAAESKPIDDFRASAAYRREVLKVLTLRALNEALAAIKLS
jgi:carbon-monoxide dehydrogenase medium subunit